MSDGDGAIGVAILLVGLLILCVCSLGFNEMANCPKEAILAEAILDKPLIYDAEFFYCKVLVDVEGTSLWIDPEEIISAKMTELGDQK